MIKKRVYDRKRSERKGGRGRRRGNGKGFFAEKAFGWVIGMERGKEKKRKFK